MNIADLLDHEDAWARDLAERAAVLKARHLRGEISEIEFASLGRQLVEAERINGAAHDAGSEQLAKEALQAVASFLGAGL